MWWVAMELFAYVCSIIEKLDAAKTADEVLREVSFAASHFNLDRFIIAGVPAPGGRLAPYVLLNHWPAGWYERYNESDYLHVDPVIKKLRNTTAPVVWSDAPYDRREDKPAAAVMNEAREFSLNNGLSIPIYTLSGDQAAVSFGGTHFELSKSDQKALYLIGIYAHNKVAALRSNERRTKKTPKLSPREIEILQWTAAGLTTGAIGDRLKIGDTTVQTHIARICVKLDCRTRTQAVAEAMRAKIIR
jgi:LuxR family quorum sensing-dependent transcriptional regulator